MKQETLKVKHKSSGRAGVGAIISLRSVRADDCEVVVGYPGLPNVVHQMENGDAVLFETTQNGIIEVRVIALSALEAEFLITEVSPRGGLLAGAVDDDATNSPFSRSELTQISESIESLKKNLQAGAKLAPEQFHLLSRKLDEIQDASQRMGRKDWINYVAGALTSTCISAAFAPDITKSIFWQSILRFLGSLRAVFFCFSSPLASYSP